jgi:predicted aminopeptidase
VNNNNVFFSLITFSYRNGYGGFAGYDRWFGQEDLGNAHLAAVGTYTDAVRGFTRLLQETGGDLPRFIGRCGSWRGCAGEDRA